jgi:hypothetical protein
MERPNWTSFIVLSTVLVLVIQLLFTNSVMAQDQNTSLAQNRSTIKIVDTKNHTITILDAKTHKTINVSNFNPTEGANTTTKVTPTTNMGNATTNETLTPEKPTIDGILTTNTSNATTNQNLTNKFNSLQGK